MGRKFDTQTINLALSILHDAVGKVATRNVGTDDVRLALRVIHRHVPANRGTVEFWRRASNDFGHPWEGGQEPYRHIVIALREAGWAVERRLTDWPSPSDRE